VILIATALAILFLGVASPLFTRRMEPATNNLVRQLGGAPQDAARPAQPVPTSGMRTVIVSPREHDGSLTTISERHVER
jgi:hypothetical protein